MSDSWMEWNMKQMVLSIAVFLAVWVGGFRHDYMSWAGNGHTPTTTGLDLETVSLQIISPPDLEDHLYHRALNHFAKAGISWNPSKSAQKNKAVLQVTLKPEPLGEVCPGKFLYDHGMELRDKVIPGSRNGRRVIDNSTWSSQGAPHILPKMTREEFEADLDEFMEKFIGNYLLGLHAYTEYFPDPQEVPLEEDQAMGEAHPSDEHEPSAHESLVGLNLSKVRFGAWAGKYSGQIGRRATQQLEQAGLHFWSTPDSHTSRHLSLDLDSQPTGECPNKVLYTATLLLTEQALIARNPKIYAWVETWRQRKVAIVESVSLEQLKADQKELIADFISSYRIANFKIKQ